MKHLSLLLLIGLLAVCASCIRMPVVATPQKTSVVSSQKTTSLKKSKGAPAALRTVVIDPGHGGDDFGTKSFQRPWLYEKSLTLRTAKLVYDFLHQWGYDVCLTRKKDVFIPLLKRAELANKIKSRLFVSIHYNSAPSRQAHGIEIYFYPDAKDKTRAKKSELLAKKILRRMIATTKAHSRGVRSGDFAVIRETQMPAVLVEAGFLSNTADVKKLRNPNYLKFLAYSIAKGIDDFVKGDKRNVLGAN